MAGGNIDLDRSLDDIIKTKKPRSTKPGKNISSRSSSGRGGSSGRGRGNARHNINIEPKTYVSSSPIHRNSNGHGGGRGSAAAINRRIGDTNDKSASQNINTRLSRTGGGAITKHGEGPAIKRGVCYRKKITSFCSGKLIILLYNRKVAILLLLLRKNSTLLKLRMIHEEEIRKDKALPLILKHLLLQSLLVLV
jgi:hypothetical protein